MKKIYIAGKISGECETPELMQKCKEKFYGYSNIKSIRKLELDFSYFIKSMIKFYPNNGNEYTHGLFINRFLIPNGTWQQYIKNDLAVLLTCDEIHMLPDWKYSKGAKIEHQLALDLGIKIIYAEIQPNLGQF